MFTRFVLLGFTGLALAAGYASAQSNKDLLKSSPQLLAALSEVVIKPSYSTVRIKCDGKDAAFGAIVRPDGWIITKASELKAAPVCVIKGSDKELPAKVVGINRAYDLAMLKVDASGLSAVEWRDTSEIQVGSWLMTPGLGKEPVAVGVASVSRRDMTDASWRYKFSPNPNSGFLGVLPETKDKRVVLTQIQATSPAGKAGAKDGDVVVSIDDEEIDSATAMLVLLAKTKPDQEVTLHLLRDGKPIDVKVKLGKRPAGPSRGDFQNSMGSTLSEKRIGFPSILQHDAVLKPNECGGPVVDLDGKTVGINIARGGRTETFVIPSEVVQTLLADLMSGRLAPVVKAKPTAAATRLKAAQDARAKAQTSLNDAKKLADDQQTKIKDAEKSLKDAEDAVKKAQAEFEAEKKKDEPKKDK